MPTGERRHIKLRGLATAVAALVLAAVVLGRVSSPGAPGPVAQFSAAMTSPFLKAGSAFHNQGGHFWAAVFGSKRMAAENEALRAELAELRVRRAREDSFEALGTLTQEVSTNIPDGSFDLISAPVLAPPLTSERQHLWIDRGTVDDLEPGMVVLSTNGVIGIVFEVYKETAVVELITDERSVWGAQMDLRDVRGLIHGTGDPRRVELHFEHTAATAEVGEMVVTSGMAGSAAPGGLPFGEIEKITHNSRGEPAAIVLLPEEPDRLRTVFVLPVVRLPWQPEKSR